MLIRISVFALAALVDVMVVPVRWDCGGIVHGTLFDGGGGFIYTSCTSSDSSLLTYGHEGYVTAAKAHQELRLCVLGRRKNSFFRRLNFAEVCAEVCAATRGGAGSLTLAISRSRSTVAYTRKRRES